MLSRPRDAWRYFLLAVILAFLLVFLVWPIVMTVRGGFVDPQGHFTLRYFIGDGVGVLRNPDVLKTIINSLVIAACTTILCTLIAMPLALISARCDFPGKAMWSSLVMVPLVLPGFVGAVGVRALIGNAGALNSLLQKLHVIDPKGLGVDFLGGAVGGRMACVIVTQALFLYPLMYLNLTAAMANLDPALEEAAKNLGAGRLRRFFTVTLPLIVPGMFAGGTIVFIWSFTELGTPIMFDYNEVLPAQVFLGLREVSSSPRPFAMVVVMLGVAVGVYLVSRWLVGGKAYEMSSKASVAGQARRLQGWAGWGAAALFGGVVAVSILPHVMVVLVSLTRPGHWYGTVLPTALTLENYVGPGGALSHEMAVGSIRNSLVYSSLAMVLCLGLGVCIAYLNVRKKVRGGWLVDGLAMLPLAVPGLVMAFGYVAMSLSWPFRGWGIFEIVGNNPNPLVLLVIAYAVRRLPFVVRSVTAGLQQTSGEMEEAALNLGASTWTAVRKVVLPLVMANVIAGAILAFSFSMLEVSDSLILAQRQAHYPITKAIYEFSWRLGDGEAVACAMGVWGMALLAVTLVGAGLLMGRKLGAVFRG